MCETFAHGRVIRSANLRDAVCGVGGARVDGQKSEGAVTEVDWGWSHEGAPVFKPPRWAGSGVQAEMAVAGPVSGPSALPALCPVQAARLPVGAGE